MNSIINGISIIARMNFAHRAKYWMAKPTWKIVSVVFPSVNHPKSSPTSEIRKRSFFLSRKIE
jgi:hypothetical protein